MAYQGLDPIAVGAAAAGLDASAARLEQTLTAIGRLVDQAAHHWEGQYSQDFASSWRTKLRPSATAAARSLSEHSALLRSQIDEQVQASGGNGAGPALAALRHADGEISGVMAGWTSAGTLGEGLELSGADALGFAKAAYADNPKVEDLPAGWRDLDDKELRRMGLDRADLHRANGLDVRIATDGHGHVVVTYAGSIELAEDWVQSNATSALSSLGVANRGNGQVEDAVDIAMSVKNAYGAENMTLVGHSLGGREAAVASVATGARAVTFNAAGPTSEDLLYAHERAGRHHSLGEFVAAKVTKGANLRTDVAAGQITNYCVLTEPLSTLQAAGAGTPALGEFKLVVPHPSLIPVIDNHNLGMFDGKV